MSKYAVAKAIISHTEKAAQEAGLDRDDVIEALMTSCIQDMKSNRSADYTRDYLRYEMDSVGGDTTDIQRR